MNTQELTDLLTSARAIAEREGQDTAWKRFSKRLENVGIGKVTAKTFKLLEHEIPEVKIDGWVLQPENYLDPVTYVPAHANGDMSHPDVEQGVIISWSEKNVKVLFCKGRTVQSTNPADLRWG